MNLNVSAVCAPNLDSVEEVKNSCCDELQDAVDRVPVREMLIVAEDFNERPGSIDTTTQPSLACLFWLRGVLTAIVW